MARRLLLFGPPGVGKGTHSKRLAADLGIPHIATGDMFREAVAKASTEFGRRAAAYMDRGELIPDPLVLEILEDRLARPDAVEGYLLDGFPRTVPQAEALATRLKAMGKRLDCVLSLEAPEQVLVNRLAGRYTCPKCNMSFNRFYRPAWVAGICDNCGASLGQRADDAENTVRQRLREYVAKTTPVLELFRAEDWPVRTILSVGEVDEIYGRIREAVREQAEAQPQKADA